MGHDNATAGGSSNPSGQIIPPVCDVHYPAYPIQDFPNHVCTRDWKGQSTALGGLGLVKNARA